jgi:hypothetical protein
VYDIHSKELTADERWLLRGMQSNLTLIRTTVRQRVFLPQEYKNADSADEQCRKRFDTICKNSGMGAEFIDLMLESVLRGAGIRFDRRAR